MLNNQLVHNMALEVGFNIIQLKNGWREHAWAAGPFAEEWVRVKNLPPFFVHQQDVAMWRYVHTPIQMVPLVSTLSHHPNK